MDNNNAGNYKNVSVWLDILDIKGCVSMGFDHFGIVKQAEDLKGGTRSLVGF